MKALIIKKLNAWRFAWEICIDEDALAYIHVRTDNITHYCSSPIEGLNIILEDKEFSDFSSAAKFCQKEIIRWAKNTYEAFNTEVQIRKEPYTPSACSMYGS